MENVLSFQRIAWVATRNRASKVFFYKAKILGIWLLLILKRWYIPVRTQGSQLSTTFFVANRQTSQKRSFPSSHYTQDSCDICF